MSYTDFFVGQTASLTRSFSATEVKNFSAVSMDDNPIHFDAAYAATTRFGQCIVQGPLVASLIGGVLGTRLPGPGTIYIRQDSKFLKPSFLDEPLTATVEITHLRADKPVITLRTLVTKENGEAVIDGEATVLYLPNQ